MKSKLFLLSVALLILCISPIFSQSFTDVTAAQSISHDYGYTVIGGTINQAGGVTFFDYDGDGTDDLLWSSERGDSLYILRNTGTGFVPDLVGEFPLDTLESKTMQWVDYDNDGDRDLFVTNYLGTPFLYRNNGNGSFANVTFAAGITTNNINAFTSVWGDYDKDGFLDLYIGNYEFQPSGYNILYHNNGNGTFTDVTLLAGVHDPNRPALAAVFFDYDNDGWPDLYVGNDRDRRNSLYKNLGNGTFQDVSIASGTGLLMWSMGCAVGDWDNNGYLDLYVTNGPWGNRLLTNNGNGTFTEMGNILGVGQQKFGWGANFFDADNDGDLDLYASATQDTISTNKARNNFYRNNGNGSWTELFNIGLEDSLNTIGTAVGDFNNDGYYDIATVGGNGDGSKLYRNDFTGNNYVKITLEGTISNRDGIGSWIRVNSANQQYVRYTHCGISFASQNSGTEILGLGTDTVLDTLIVDWLSGVSDTLLNVAAGSQVHVIEGGITIGINGTPIFSTCFGADDGAVNIQANGGPTGNYTYLWSPIPAAGQGTASISGLSPGTYTVTVSDGQFSAVDSFVVEEPPALVLSSVVTPPTCKGPNDGRIDLTVSGGTPGYTFLWAHGPNLQNAEFLDSGRYVVTVTDTMGCVAQDSADLVYSNPLNLNFTTTSASCAGGNDGAIDVTVTGGSGNYRYFWSFGDTVADPMNVSAGSHMVVIMDTIGCLSSFSVPLADPPPLLLSYQTAYPSCSNTSDGMIDLSVSGGTPGYTYAWSDSSTGQDPVGLTGGTYLVTVTDSNGCTADTTVTLIQPNPLSLVLTGFDVACAGGMNGGVDLGPLGGVGNYTYLWSTGDTTQDIMNQPAGTYLITLTDGNGCSATDSAIVNEPPPLQVTFTVDSLSCFGSGDGQILVSVTGGTPGYTYNWAHGPTTDFITGLAAGIYSVVVQDTQGCSLMDSITVFEPIAIPVPVISRVGDTLIASPALNYQWYLNGTEIIGANNSKLYAVVNGDYFVQVTDSNGCSVNSDTVSFLIGQAEIPLLAGWQVYPNPGTGLFWIQGPNLGGIEVSMELWNGLGQWISRRTSVFVSKPLSLDLSDQPAGLYLLNMTVGDTHQTYRLIKK